MNIDEVKVLEKKICKYLALLSFADLTELKISGQQQIKIKKGEVVHFYAKTRERLAKLVTKNEPIRS